MFDPSNKTGKFSAADGRAGNALTCEACGRPLHPKRGSRRQRYCNYSCRDEARRARNFAGIGATHRPARHRREASPRSTLNSPAVGTTCKGTFGDRAYSIDGPREVVRTEVIADWVWHPVKSPDGVTCQATRIQRVDSPIAVGVISRWEPTWTPTWWRQFDLPIPSFLKRPIPATVASPAKEAA